MPFLGMDMGAGHSELSNRFHYLAACFWSFYVTYPHIVAVVKSQADYDFARLVVPQALSAMEVAVSMGVTAYLY
jgi:hypothetical protein